jgi:hypothetical protein
MSWRVAAATRAVCDAVAVPCEEEYAGDDDAEMLSSTFSVNKERLLTAARNCCRSTAGAGDDGDVAATVSTASPRMSLS